MTAKPVLPAAAYLRDDGRVMLAPSRLLAWLHAEFPIRQRMIERRGEDRELDEMLLASWTAACSRPPDSPLIAADCRVVETEPTSLRRWLSTKQAARRLGLQERQVRNLCRDRKLPAVKPNEVWLISPADLDEFEKGRTAA